LHKSGKQPDKFYQEIRERYDKGIPQPDEVINKLAGERIAKFGETKGLIIDGYPLSLGQAAS